MEGERKEDVAPEFGTGLRKHLEARGVASEPDEPPPPEKEPRRGPKWLRRKRRPRRPR